MARLSIKLDGARFRRAILKARPAVQRRARDALSECAIDLQREAKRRAPVDTGQTRADIQIDFSLDGLTAEVGNEVPWAPFLEFGTGPHKSRQGQAEFVRGIERWAKRVLGLEPDEIFPILRKIRRRGTPAQPYLGPAWESVREGCVRLLEREVFRGVDEAFRG